MKYYVAQGALKEPDTLFLALWVTKLHIISFGSPDTRAIDFFLARHFVFGQSYPIYVSSYVMPGVASQVPWTCISNIFY